MINTSLTVSLFALVAVVGLALPVQAQEPPAQTLRIGVLLPPTDESNPLDAVVVEAALQGATMAVEEFAFNAEMFGVGIEIVTVNAEGDDLRAAADELVATSDIGAVVGGFGMADATTLGEWASETGLPFINIGSSSDALRNEACQPTTFHVAPSAAMYLDAMAGWYVRAGFRRWYVIQSDEPESAAQYERLQWTLEERFFGAEEAGHAIVPAGTPLDAATLQDIASAEADLVLLLAGAEDQLAAISALDQSGIEATVAGFPYEETQTRRFFEDLEQATTNLPANFRAAAWEASLDAYGARELNARFRERWNYPMEPSAWAMYQAIKILYESAVYGGSLEPGSIVSHLNNPQSIFDVWKGIGTNFRPWDRQLRQPVYLVEINGEAADPLTRGLLVGELPAIYMPGTDPLERLDQLGDLADRSACN